MTSSNADDHFTLGNQRIANIASQSTKKLTHSEINAHTESRKEKKSDE